jgi:predicted nucleic acid-binding protein
MPRAVLDSTVLVSAFLTPPGAAHAVLQAGIEDRFTCLLAEEILEETICRLHSPRLQQRYGYSAPMSRFSMSPCGRHSLL